MEYLSQIVIAVSKEVMVKDLVDPQIPAFLKDMDSYTNDRMNCVFWEFQDWKWHSSISEIQQLEAWFQRMEDAGDSFGVLRVGEEGGDTQTWGEPYDFDIFVNRYIEYPRP